MLQDHPKQWYQYIMYATIDTFTSMRSSQDDPKPTSLPVFLLELISFPQLGRGAAALYVVQHKQTTTSRH